MQENRWDEESASFIPVEPESDPINVNFDKLSLEVQNAVLVKFGTCGKASPLIWRLTRRNYCGRRGYL